MKIKNAPMSSGFTLVELVMVIILVGVLSALGVGLFASRSAFSPLLVTQQLASATLLAQQAALAGNSSNTVTIEQDSDALSFIVGGQNFSLKRNGATLSYRQQSQTRFSAVTSGGYSVSFDAMGRVAAPIARANIDFRISGDSQFDLCLSSLGAVYAGTCQ